MPYAQDMHGVYRLKNIADGACYVGSSKRVKKRISDHFCLLSQNRHPNYILQEAYNKYGREAFSGEVEVVCEDPKDLASIEEMFLQGLAVFNGTEKLYNISTTAKTPMAGRKHTEATKKKLSLAKKGVVSHVTDDYRKKLSDAQRNRFLSDESFLAKIRYIVNNDHLSYAERGRHLGLDTSSVRKLALKYQHLKGS
jgi:group I intron endonuclease